MNRRWNKFWIGLTLGVVLPLVVFMMVFLIGYGQMPFGEFLMVSFKMKALPKILSLCAIPNLIIFYLFLNKEFWWATRGVIAATLLCTLGMAAVKLFA